MLSPGAAFRSPLLPVLLVYAEEAAAATYYYTATRDARASTHAHVKHNTVVESFVISRHAAHWPRSLHDNFAHTT